MIEPTADDRIYVPREVARAGSTSDLCEQFVLSTSSDAPDGFLTECLASWTLAHHPSLPVIGIHSTTRKSDEVGRLGWLLGYPITADGRLLGAGASIVADADLPGFVDSLGGRFLAVFVNVPSPAIYPDAAGSYSSVYCPSHEMAASTPGLIPYDDATEDRVELVKQLGIPLTNSMYPLGLTPRHGVHRLLPNHHVDLTSWTMVRHGPTWRERGAVSIEESVERVAAIVRRNIGAVMDARPSYLQLTAGNDSRMLLACARERRSDLAAYTLKLPDLDGRNDAKVAAQISKLVGVSHQVVPMLTPDPADLEMWMYRISCAVGEPRGWRAATAYRSLDRSRAHIAGNIGDLARTGYWDSVDSSRNAVTLEQLTVHALAHRRRQLDPGQQMAAGSTEVREEIERWRDSAPTVDSYALVDLLFVENRLACWAGVWPYAQYYGPGFTYFPMNHREVIDLMAGLPETVRRNKTFNQMVIHHEWPELLGVPFNTPSRSVRAANLSARVVRGARRRLGRLHR